MKKIILKNQHLFFPIFDIALNGFNYFFHIFISWYILPSDYGVLNSLLSFSAILLVAGIAFQTYTAKSIAESKVISNIIIEIFKVSSIFAILALFFLLVTMPAVKSFTRGGYSSVILIILIFIINIYLSVFRGIMQGSNEFLNLNISFYIEVFSKLIFLFVILPRSGSINTALLSIIFGMIFSLTHSVYINKGKLLNNSTIRFREIKIKDSFRKISKVYIASFFFYFYTSIDMIIVNYYLPNDSGYYAVILKYSQILLFVSFSMITVFIPLLSRSKENQIAFKKYIFTALGLISFISISVIMVYRFFAPPTVTMFFGEEYAEAQNYLTLGLLPYVFLVLSNLFINVHIILENTEYLITLLVFSLIIFILLNIFHSSIKTILYIETICYACLFVFLVIQYVITIRKREGLNELLGS